MPIIQNIETGFSREVSCDFVKQCNVIKLMLEDTGGGYGSGSSDEPIPVTVDIDCIANLDYITKEFADILLVAPVRDNGKLLVKYKQFLDFIEHFYEYFLTDYVNCNNKEPEFKWRLDAIHKKIGIEGIIGAFKTANFLDAPHLERGIAFLIGYLLNKNSYDTKFRVFSHMRYNLGHLTSTQETYEPIEPIHPGWQDLICLMEPVRFALSREVISIINNTASYKVDDKYLKELQQEIDVAFISDLKKIKVNPPLKVVTGSCNGCDCFRVLYLHSTNYNSDYDDEYDYEYDDDYEYEIRDDSEPDEVISIKKASRKQKAAMIENISFLETSDVTCLRDIFKSCDKLNLPLLWNVSNVLDFQSVFSNAVNFNQSLNWNTRSGINMQFMFQCASEFNQGLKWNTSNVNRMDAMFFRCKEFNSPLDFDTSSLEHCPSMFAETTKFNQPVNFNMSKVKSLDSMFRGAKKFNQPVNWDTPNLLKISNMFQGAVSFNQPVPFNTSRVKMFDSVFRGARCFNQPVNWDLSNALSVNRMFKLAVSFNHPIVSRSPKLNQMDEMFCGAINFNSPVELDTSRVAMMREVFKDARVFNQSLNNWQFVKAYVMTDMFLEAEEFSHRLPFDHTTVKYPCALFN
jgi:hypothetical protein